MRRGGSKGGRKEGGKEILRICRHLIYTAIINMPLHHRPFALNYQLHND